MLNRLVRYKRLFFLRLEYTCLFLHHIYYFCRSYSVNPPLSKYFMQLTKHPQLFSMVDLINTSTNPPVYGVLHRGQNRRPIILQDGRNPP